MAAHTEQRLSEGDVEEALKQVPDWELKEDRIRREFAFKDFDQAMDFVNRVADIARQQDHHPDMCIHYNKVELVLSTHKAGGLTREDFDLASKTDELLTSEQCTGISDW